MTYPADSYYESIIRDNPLYRLRRLDFRWRWFYSAKRIRSFSWIHSGEIFTYRKSCLTVQKAPVNPAWQVPNSYYTSISIPLSSRQVRKIRSVLGAIPFSQMHTTACSFVNWMEKGMISEDFRCHFLFGFSYRFADGNPCISLEPLEQILKQIAETSDQYGKISSMEARLFTEQRWARLHPDTQERN